MVKFLITLPGFDRNTQNLKIADLGQTTALRPLLTPLQLAFKLGDSVATEFIILERAIVQWEWGPLSSLAIRSMRSIPPAPAPTT